MISLGVLLVGVLGTAAAAKLPDSFRKCNRNDPNLSNCLTAAIDQSIPQLSKGLPNLGLIPIDPLRITQLDIKQGDGPVAIDLHFQDLDIKNIGSAKVKKATADVDKYHIEIEGDLQNPLILDGDYEIAGKVLILPINGKGKAHIELDDVKSVLTLQGKEKTKDGRIYMELVDLRMKFDTSKMRIKLENLFNNDKALSDNMNIFLNENWKEILNEIKPAIEEGLSAAFKEIARRLFNKVPYDDIFLK